MTVEQTLEFTKKFTEDLLSFFEVNPEVTVTSQDGFLYVNVESSEQNSLLIGRGSETLRSLQQIISTVLRNNDAAIDRVNLDIAGYKQQRAEQLAEKARAWIEEVRTTGDSYIARINAADRRIVHQVATEYDDIATFSEGEGRDRHLIIAQKTS